jgi:hypothetical protein
VVRFFGLAVSGRNIVVRFLLAFLFSMFAFVAFVVLPSRIANLASAFFPLTAGTIGATVASSLIAPSEPTLGLLIVLLMFAGVFLRGTNLYGPLLILNGLVYVVLVYTFFRGGLLDLSALGDVFGAQATRITVTADTRVLMTVLLIGPALTILKGLLLMRRGPKTDS